MLLGWHQTLMWTALAMVVLHGARSPSTRSCASGSSACSCPALAPWRPVPVAAGIVTGWLMLALAASFHVRRRIGQRRWRLLHYASFAAFAIGLYHALNVGTDLTGTRGLIFAGIVAAPVVWLDLRAHPDAAPRSADRRPPAPHRQHPRPAAQPPERRRAAVPA